MQTEELGEQQVRRLSSLVSTAMGLFSFCLLVFCVLAHQMRPDILTAATICPLFLWILAGLLLALFSGKWRIVLICGWLATGYFLGDAPVSMMRGWRAEPASVNPRQAEPTALRIVSLNCRSDPKAAEEVGTWQPDIVLLQESPSRKTAEELAQVWFGPSGSLAWRGDVSIVANGPLEVTDPLEGEQNNFVFRKLSLASGEQLGVVSLHLVSTLIRTDIWDRDCWEYYRDNHRARREKVAEIMRQINKMPDLPLVVGGDFNTPARDSVFRLMQPRLHDAFQEAGRGWGKTVTNEWPVHRIDQIWLSQHLRAVSATAHKTVYSDHRLVVCDVVLVQP